MLFYIYNHDVTLTLYVNWTVFLHKFWYPQLTYFMHRMMCRPLRKVCPNCTEWRWLSKYKLQYAAQSSTLALIKYFIHQTAKILILSFDTRKSTILTHFCNPEIPGLGRCQSRDSGLAKMAGIPGFGIPGLQSLVVTCVITQTFWATTKHSDVSEASN